MKHILLMDTDTAYVENAAAWAGLHTRDKVRLTIMTDPDAAFEALKKSLPVDCILITSTMLLAMEPDTPLMPLAEVILLEDGESVIDVLEPIGRMRHLSKYQSIRSLFETILESSLPLKQTGASFQRTHMTVSFTCLHAGLGSELFPVAAAMALLLASWRYRVFFFDLEFGMVKSPFCVPTGESDICDLLLHAKNIAHRNAKRLQECMAKDADTGVYVFRDEAGFFEHEDLDYQSFQWILASLVQSNSFDFIVINAGTNTSKHMVEAFLETDYPFFVFDGASEQKTQRCQKLLKSLQKTPQLLEVNSIHGEKVLSCGMSQFSAGVFPVSPLLPGADWMQNSVFLGQVAGAILPHIKGGA